MKESRPFLPRGVEDINPLSLKESTDVVAGRICGCAGCRAVAEPILKKNPLLRDIDYKKAQEMWKLIREGVRGARQ